MAENWERLVEVLADEQEWTTAGALADRLGVTARTIRSYVARANTDVTLVASGPAGYRLDRGVWAAHGVPSGRDASPAARAARLIRSLVDADEGLDVHESAAALFVSESTIEADLGRIRARLDGTGLSLARRGSLVELIGPESARRRLLGALFREESARGMATLDELRAAFPALPSFRDALVSRLSDAGYAPNEFALNDVLLHLVIALDRLAHDHPLDDAELSEASLGPADPGDLTELLDGLVREQFGRSLGRAELVHLARLLGTRAATRSASTDAAGPATSERAELVRTIVARAAAEYLVELDDDDFIERLALHVDNLVARAGEERYARNPLTATIKSAYPLIYDLAVYIANELQHSERILVNDDEIAYIAMHVGAHLDRRRAASERVRVAVVAPAYHDVHTALAERISTVFGAEVDLVALVDHVDVAWSSLPAELVISVIPPTAPVEHLVRVAPFPTDDDLDRVRVELARIRRARRRARLAAALSQYIAPELFIRGLRGLDREQAIRLLGERMIAQGVIDEAYVEGAIERERLSSTAFTEHLAVPHAMTMSARRTAIAIAIDEHPIDWDGARVNVVALIAFSEEGRAEFQDVFDQFVEAFSERENVQRLVRGATDYPGLLAELARLMEP
ncbi:BglG family transcription antiterminator [Agromyces ramosus]|uniref:Lichenan operon transcriptional antiterminator n=1 Tax=Agromyces ramosus TaxID=33879 RepID=A0ABU0R564_9MICO|nr:PTS sugar transporter subunit IIA [Agromyces ramosus]MDQ0893221.1 lichenan operon transcriptional antiterminator [Agromyces ramosus]